MKEEPTIDIVAVQKMTNFIPVDCPSVNVVMAPVQLALSDISA